MNVKEVVKESFSNFDGKIAIYYDDLKGNIIKNQKYHEMVGDGIDNIYKDIDNSFVKYIATKSGKISICKK